MTEAELQRQIIAAARQLGYRVAHFRSVKTPRGWQTPVQADGAGFPDLLLIRGDRLLVAELKSEGKYPAPAQRLWLSAFEAAGIPAYIWRPAQWVSGEIVGVLLGQPQRVDRAAEDAGQLRADALGRLGDQGVVLPAVDRHRGHPHAGGELGLGHAGGLAEFSHAGHCTTPLLTDRTGFVRVWCSDRGAAATAPGQAITYSGGDHDG